MWNIADLKQVVQLAHLDLGVNAARRELATPPKSVGSEEVHRILKDSKTGISSRLPEETWYIFRSLN